MAEQIRISEDGRCIVITSQGPPSLAEMQDTLAKLAELREAHGINHVLVDSRGRTGQPPLAEIYQGGKLLAEILGPKVRLAVVVAQVEPDHTLFENVAVNRGAILAFFENVETARHWLFER